MVLAYYRIVLTEQQYNELTKRRDGLVELQKSATLPKHKTMIQQQLQTIRTTIKEAHHERYKRTGQA